VGYPDDDEAPFVLQSFVRTSLDASNLCPARLCSKSFVRKVLFEKFLMPKILTTKVFEIVKNLLFLYSLDQVGLNKVCRSGDVFEHGLVSLD
jgi:hypothetical protein